MRRARVAAVFAGFTFAVLVFSYLYLWTATAAWLACIGVLWLCLRPTDWRKSLAAIVTIGGIATVALVPYVYLLSKRAATLDEQQILISTHRPDLLRIDEILGAVILLVLIIGVLRSKIDRTDQRLIYAASLALLPFVVFNQQILTGRTMQAYHFEAFVVNYSTLVALVVTVTLLWVAVPNRLLIYMAALSFSWGILEVGIPSRLVFVPWAIVKDQGIPVLLRLNDLSKQDGTLSDLHTKRQTSALVFSPDISLIALQPTWTAQATLLDISGVDCGNITREERKELFYMHLYYSKAGVERLSKSFNERDQFAIVMIFGHQRLFPALSSQFNPIQPDEVEREVQAYQTYANSFSREEALKRPITYAVIPVEGNFDFSNLDRWYERDAGERIGDYTLYRLKLRD